jgi:hypothetical protein
MAASWRCVSFTGSPEKSGVSSLLLLGDLSQFLHLAPYEFILELPVLLLQPLQLLLQPLLLVTTNENLRIRVLASIDVIITTK